MKTFLLIISLGLLATDSSIGATSMVASDGTPFLFEEWSAAVSLGVKSTDGEIQLTRRTCRATRQHPISPETFTIELLFHPVTKEVWLGEPQQQYAVVGQKIWGLTPKSTDLWITRSAAAGDAANGEELIIEEFLKKFLADPRTELWIDENSTRLDLCRIFGWDVICLKQAAPAGDLTEISQLAVDAGGLTLALKSKTGHVLSLTVGENLEVRAASNDGDGVLVLFDGLLPLRKPREWSPPVSNLVPSPKGQVAAVHSTRSYWLDDEQGLLTTARAVVITATGDLWVGPSDCRLVSIDGRLLGFMIENRRDLLVFVGPQARIPRSQDSIHAFREELLRFEREFEANQHQWKPDLRVRIADLYQGDARFPAAGGFSMRSVLARDQNAVILLNSDNSRAYPEVVIAPDLRILSTKVLDRPDRAHSRDVGRFLKF